MRNLLVTGGAGFIGSNYILFHRAKYPNDLIINLDKLTYAGNLGNLSEIKENQNYKFVKGDICDFNLVWNTFTKNNIDTIVHFAAESHVDKSIANPKVFFESNIIGTANLCEVANRFWKSEDFDKTRRPHFHHISTDEVFGSLGPGDPSFQENSPYLPHSPYAASKASSDLIVRSYYHTYNLPITISNCSNNYGPFQYPEKLIPLIILNAISGKQIPLYGDGKQIRDWLFVEDHCEAISTILEKGIFGESYNLGGNNQPTNYEIVIMICKILNYLLPNSLYLPHEKLITFVTDRPGHDRRYAMNIDKVQTNLNWTPRETLESGLKKTVRWYLSHNDWIKSISEKLEYNTWIEKNYSKRPKKEERK